MHHGGVEGDGATKIKVIHVVLEVLQQLAVVRKIRPVRWNRKVLEGQTPLRGIYVQAGIAG